ncbi:NAD(P)H-dependent glycerol-3-phosphate dehydrogenase [Limobrevibacterium gyesilva]|uniref:Glycerol-3-phosphate dehydrogenase [NAD(P)+] n=1 Tax=Limobrevibacterium gyesilva TaxID=2991712 RepID=A0AA41YQ70_9PROT|nr:NAD(P)H-dependent glycerol-3-phosphate dehydrogenase [Limobrevibacterium gyesilva]MCW3474608.1 NAD(P)H-dependent glycerol-3-phosphate dehydrogenase [Limobrevibacterium gyesilva]
MRDPGPVNEVAVVGAGAWGTALALQAARAGRMVTLWARDPARAAAIAATRENPRLPGVRLPESIRVTAALPAGELVLLAVPAQHLRGIAAQLPPGGPLVVCAKGVEAGTHLLPLEVLAQVLPGRLAAVLTGPSFAHEIAAGLPAAAVVAAADAGLRAIVMATLATPDFRLYGNDDPIGAQVGGAAKNVIAIAAGAVIGAGLGENARAALVTRGLAELARLAVALGGRADTVAGLSGLGDLLLTCTGSSSRNYSLGVELGRGGSLQAILAARSAVTEGVATAPALVARAEAAGVQVPVCAAVAGVVTGAMTVREAIIALQSRPLRDE